MTPSKQAAHEIIDVRETIADSFERRFLKAVKKSGRDPKDIKDRESYLRGWDAVGRKK